LWFLLVENKILSQYTSIVEKNWKSKTIAIPYDSLSKRELFEIAYHTCNDVQLRTIWIKLSPDENQPGSTIIMYNSTKKYFCKVQAIEDEVNVIYFANNEEEIIPLAENIEKIITNRKNAFNALEDNIQNQLLKSIIVLRKVDETINGVMISDITRKVYFSIGDTRETAAVIPMMVEAEGYSLVQLALNKWMTFAQKLPQEQEFPIDKSKGLLKNFIQIKKWLLGQIKVKLES
jgi:hypothetical protein